MSDGRPDAPRHDPSVDGGVTEAAVEHDFTTPEDADITDDVTGSTRDPADDPQESA